MEEEEKRRQALVEKQAADLGDAHWVLEHPQPAGTATAGHGLRPSFRVVQVGFAQLDHHDAKEDTLPQSAGRELSDVPKRRRYNMKADEVGVGVRVPDNHGVDKSLQPRSSAGATADRKVRTPGRTMMVPAGRHRHQHVGVATRPGHTNHESELCLRSQEVPEAPYPRKLTTSEPRRRSTLAG